MHYIMLVKNGDLFNEHRLPISFKRVQHIDQSQHWHIYRSRWMLITLQRSDQTCDVIAPPIGASHVSQDDEKT